MNLSFVILNRAPHQIAASFLACLAMLSLTACGAKKAAPKASGIAAKVDSATSTITATTSILADGIATSKITILLLDSAGKPVAGVTPQFSVSGTGNTQSPCSLSDATGTSTCSFVTVIAESKAVAIVWPVDKTGDSVTFLAGSVAKVCVATEPASGVAGVAFSQQPIFKIGDINCNLISNATNAVTVTLSAGTGTLSGTTTVSAIAGIVTMNNLSLQLSGTDKKLTAAASGLTSAETAAFTVTSAAATQLAIVTQPDAAFAGTALLQQPVVEVRDIFGNKVTNSTAAILFTLSTGSGALTGTATKSAVAGVATFTNLKVDLIGTKEITASSSGLTSVVSSPFTVAPGLPTKLSFSTQPGTGTSGTAFVQPVVQILDAQNNLVTSATSAVTLALSSGTGTLAGTATVAAVGGVAVFSGLNIDVVGSKVLSASATGLTSADSSSFTINPGAATKLSFSVQSGGGTAGAAWAQQPVVQILDAQNNLVTAATNTITLSLGSGTGTLSGSSSFSATAGTAAFTGLSLNLSGSKTLSASAGGLSSATSASFTITVGAATMLTLSTQPGNGIAGAALGQQPVVQITDAQGNLITSATNSVTLALTTGTGALSGTSTVIAVGGVAIFSGLNIDLSGAKNLTAASSGLTSAVTSSFSISAGAATQLSFSTVPGGGAAGVTWSQQPVVRVLDAQGNLVTTATNSIALSVASGTGSISGTSTLAATSGIATFSGLTMTASGAKTLSAAAAGLTSATSSSFSVTPGIAVAGSTVTSSSSSILANGATTSAITVTLLDTYSNPVSGASVQLVSSRGATDTIVTSPATSNASGVATFNVSSGTAGACILTASVPASSVTMTTTPTVTFETTTANIAQSSWSVQTVSQVANGSSTSTVNVTVRNSSNTALAGKAVTLVSSRGATDTIVGSPATTNASGIVSFTIKSSTRGDASLTIAVTTDSVTITNQARVLFLDVAPFSDYQPRFAKSSSTSMSPGTNSTSYSTFKDLFNLGPNDGTLYNFNFNGTTSGWGTSPDRLLIDGANDYVNFGTNMNSQANQTQEIWVKPTSPTALGKVFFSNGDDTNYGFTMRQSWEGSGKIEVTIGSNPSYLGEIYNDAPTGFWRLNETAGTAAAAFYGTAGTYTGTYTLNQSSALFDNRSSVLFNGSTGYVTMGNTHEGTNNFTVEAWVYATSVTGVRTIASKQSATRGFAMDLNAGKARFTVINSAGTVFSATGTTTLNLSQWYHVVGVRDNTASRIRIYVNGVEEANTVISGTLGTSTNGFYIGNNQGFAGRFFQGRIDEVAVYSAMLSPARIIAHSDAGARPTCYSNTAMNTSTWYQMVSTFNSSTKDLKLYVNGTSECTLTNTGLFLETASWPLAIGGSLNASSSVVSGTLWQGQVGDARIYNSVLSAAQVTNTFNAVTGRYP